jgi:NitT/TauT family transport system substrate-binding protein
LIPIILLITFPLTTSIYKGLVSTPIEIVEYYTFCGLSKNKILFHIRFPYALPYFFSGLRIASSSCVSYAVSGEFVGAQEGLGVLIQLFRREFDFVSLAASILILLILSLTFYSFALLLEKIFSSIFIYGWFKKKSIFNNSFNIHSVLKGGT